MNCIHLPNMPCGFDVESLVDFETALTSTSVAFQSGGHCDDWTAISEFDSEALALIKDSSIDTTNSSKSCSSQRSTNHSTSMTSPSSYCRRMGSASSGRRGSPLSFQLWSPRLRLRDERKRVLKMSLAKLRRIEDPESCLRRSVLLNNTLRRLQRESRDDKVAESTKMPELQIPMAVPEPAVKRRRTSGDCVEDEMASELSRIDDEEPPKKMPKTTPAPSNAPSVSANQRPALRPCNSMAPSSGFSGLVASSGGGFDADKQFSCGQSSLLFGELQSVVFHSLITSLES